MKYLLSITILLLAHLSYGQVSSAENAVKRAERKVADRMIEKTFNGIVDKLFGSDSTKVTKDESVKTDSTVTRNSRPFGGLFSAKTVDKKYVFDLTLDTEIKTVDKKGKGDPISALMHYSSDSSYMATEMESAIAIMDFGSMKNYTIIGGNVTSLDLQKVLDKAARMGRGEDESSEEVSYKKTGRKEMIAGYECEEYTMETEEFKGAYWITEKIGLNVDTYVKAFQANPSISYPEGMQGVMLRMKLEDFENKTTTTMETNEVIKQEVKYDLSKYKVTDLSRFGF